MDDAPEVHPAPPTRSPVAKRLGVSIACVRKWEAAGVLHPTKDAAGVYRFAEVEVEALRMSRRGRATPTKNGEVEAELFTRFDRGEDLRAIVVATKLPSETVRKVYREWTITLADGEKIRRQRERDEKEDRFIREENARADRERKEWEKTMREDARREDAEREKRAKEHRQRMEADAARLRESAR